MGESKDHITKAFAFRHACKEFNEKKVSEEDVRFILESGRLSPSSFGMQPWRFIVVSNQELKELLFPASYNQVQVTTCSHLIVICARTDIKSSDDYYKKVMDNRSLPEEKQTRIKSYLDKMDDDTMLHYTREQCFIALGNMMTVAASIGIDSCPMGGFDKDEFREILKLPEHIHPCVLMPIGYRLHEQSKQDRVGFDDVVEFR